MLNGKQFICKVLENVREISLTVEHSVQTHSVGNRLIKIYIKINLGKRTANDFTIWVLL